VSAASAAANPLATARETPAHRRDMMPIGYFVASIRFT
jgi:hypothetical protein